MNLETPEFQELQRLAKQHNVSPLPFRSATPAICAGRAEPELRRWPEGGVCGSPGTADPAPERLQSRPEGEYPGFQGSARPPPGQVASVRAQGGRSPTGARTDATA